MSKQITFMGETVWPQKHRDIKGRFSVKSYIKYQLHRLWAFTKYVLKLTGIAVAAFIALSATYAYGQIESSREITVVNQQVTKQEIAPILKKIAQAESGGHQFDADGLPTMHANTNGSVDLGIMQINNKVWGKKAKELGFDLLTEKGNIAMATWILENKGSDAWNSSKQNWN